MHLIFVNWNNFVALQFEFLLDQSTISSIVRETCQILWETLQPQEMPEPNPNQWTEIANKFYLKTNLPNCIGAVDGKYIRCINPNNSGSIYFNYKKYFSIVLMAVVDSEYIFTAIDDGAYGREAASIVFKECPFGKKLYSVQLNLPASTCLPNTNTCPQPPYAERGLTEKRKIFNYRLSRARRYVECTFGILANKWRVLHSAMLLAPDFADDVVKACCILHNYVRRRDGYRFEDTFSNDIEVFQNRNSNRNLGVSQQRIDIRDYFAEYFINSGSLNVRNNAYPTYPEFTTFISRLKIFNIFPLTSSQDKYSLAESGFIYSWKKYIVERFCCGLILHHWEKEHNPWIEYSRWNPKF
ncbi:protein ALP1-like [Aphis craccivora]|uniref:Protein ALP1-like n=1 Tax=Aphis craccivora TaxID=307492 RepID=A0A6G0VN47_APHCR|nr:protein ALP1-like [Aphis craccivora]